MGKIGKISALILSLIVALPCLTLLTVDTANAQTVPKTPEFTLKLIAHPYDKAPITSIDPYTGKTIVAQEGYHSDNKSIEITIKNQEFIPYKDSNGHGINLMYNIRWKGHFDTTDNWSYFAGTATRQEYSSDYFRPSSTQYSTWAATLSLDEWERGSGNYDHKILVPVESQIDFQVEALIGYSSQRTGQAIEVGAWSVYDFTGIDSGWSSTQTLNLADGSVSPTPTVPEQSWLVILPLLLSALCVAVAIRYRKNVNFKR
ncbi:MAG: hypothetical protein ACFCUE_03635 [Candidatus Bathyarchaeia archaeon]|jgi:hypothetical protein